MSVTESASNVNARALLEAVGALQSALDHRDATISAAHELGRSDWRCLQWLRDNGPQSPSAVCAALGLTSGSVTALLDRLEKRGLIERRADPVDRRALRIALRDPAHELLARTNAPLVDVTDRLTARWGAERAQAAQRACLDLAKLVQWVTNKA